MSQRLKELEAALAHEYRKKIIKKALDHHKAKMNLDRTIRANTCRQISTQKKSCIELGYLATVPGSRDFSDIPTKDLNTSGWCINCIKAHDARVSRRCVVKYSGTIMRELWKALDHWLSEQ